MMVKFNLFCSKYGHNAFFPSINVILEFLTSLYEEGCSYSTINTARSALSTMIGGVDGASIGSNNLVTRLLKGVSRSRPPKCKYNVTWDTNLVLNYISKMGNNDSLSLRELSKKLAALLALCSGQRVQTLSKLKTDEIFFKEDKVIINVSSRLKTSKPGIGTTMKFPKFTQESLCVFVCLEFYLNRTSVLRSTSDLFIQTKKPFKKACSQTISKWLKEILKESGINADEFSSHSFRHASTSKAASVGVSIDKIFEAAGWSNTSKVFANFYNKPIVDECAFASSILESRNP